MTGRVVFIDDDTSLRAAAEQWFGLAGLEVDSHADPLTALSFIESSAKRFDGVVVTDVRMPRCDGLEILKRTMAADADIPVILLTGHGDVNMAVDAMRQGAYDFLEKPFDPDRVLDAVRRALAQRRLTLENRALREQLEGQETIERRLAGQSEAIKSIRRTIAELARDTSPVLISGETGTGKDVVARLLHDLSARAGSRFVTLDCAAIQSDNFESDLFGHVRGAVSGTTRWRQGRIKLADGGTLFLDNVTALPASLQTRLLRVIENGELLPLGADTPQDVDIRFIASCTADPDDAVAEGTLSPDFLHRIGVFRIALPPLRERRDDIAMLFAHFSADACRQYGSDVREADAAALAALSAHDFPGNVRELRNIAERFCLSGGTSIQDTLSPGALTNDSDSRADYRAQVRDFERQLILSAIDRHGADMTAVMDDLALPRRTLNEKMRRLGIRRMT